MLEHILLCQEIFFNYLYSMINILIQFKQIFFLFYISFMELNIFSMSFFFFTNLDYFLNFVNFQYILIQKKKRKNKKTPVEQFTNIVLDKCDKILIGLNIIWYLGIAKRNKISKKRDLTTGLDFGAGLRATKVCISLSWIEMGIVLHGIHWASNIGFFGYFG